MNTRTAHTPEPLLLRTQDGYNINALRYPATGPVRGHLVVAGATGVPQRFYRAFAVYAATQGYTNAIKLSPGQPLWEDALRWFGEHPTTRASVLPV
jgi:predicted alpha/beta hydrolase